MATETELKLKVADLTAVRRRLHEVGAIRRGERFEVNTFFDTPDRSLKRQGRGLRLRTMTGESGDVASVITFKGPAAGDVVKRREEIEFGIANPEEAALLLDRLGYRPTLGFEKRRETWAFDHCLVELDEVPHLGTFVEIESDDEAAIARVRAALGLAAAPAVARGYISLIDELVRDQPDLGPTVRFGSRHGY